MRKLKFLLDEDTPSKCAVALRKRGIDAIHIIEVNHQGLSDEEQLDFAISEERCIVTFNIAHFVNLFEECLKIQKEHYGIIINKQLKLNELYYRLIVFYDKFTSEELKNNILFLNRY